MFCFFLIFVLIKTKKILDNTKLRKRTHKGGAKMSLGTLSGSAPLPQQHQIRRSNGSNSCSNLGVSLVRLDRSVFMRNIRDRKGPNLRGRIQADRGLGKGTNHIFLTIGGLGLTTAFCYVAYAVRERIRLKKVELRKRVAMGTVGGAFSYCLLILARSGINKDRIIDRQKNDIQRVVELVVRLNGTLSEAEPSKGAKGNASKPPVSGADFRAVASQLQLDEYKSMVDQLRSHKDILETAVRELTESNQTWRSGDMQRLDESGASFGSVSRLPLTASTQLGGQSYMHITTET